MSQWNDCRWVLLDAWGGRRWGGLIEIGFGGDDHAVGLKSGEKVDF